MTKIGLRSWLLLCSLLPALLVSVFLGAYFSYVQHQQLAVSLTERGSSIAVPLALTSGELLKNQQLTAVQQLIDSTHRQNSPLVSNISLYDGNNQLVHSSNPQQPLVTLQLNPPGLLPENGSQLHTEDSLLTYQKLPVVNQVSSDGVPADNGYLVVQLRKDQLQLQQLSGFLKMMLLVSACLLLCCVPGIYMLQKINRPIRRINLQLEKFLEGRYSQQTRQMPIRELEKLQQGVNQVALMFLHQEQDVQQQIEQVTSDLQQSMEQLEVHNIQLDFAKRKALEENRQKSEFLAKMSHELRTPLNGVIGFTRQLLKTQLNTNQHDYLTTIQKSANSLLHLVNDVLDFSKLEEGRLSINPEPFSLRDLLNDATELLAANAFEKHLELVLMVEPGCPDDLIADPLRFTQVLMNIAGNAIKFTDHGSIVIRISHTLLNEDQLILHCSVQDTGRGISDEQQQQLFQGFGASEPKSHQTGSGLGLMISQKLVQAMNGKIGFESKSTEGSTFWFTIKCQRHHLSVAENLPVDVLENKTLLYFEPQQYSREATMSLLHSWGLQVTVCATKSQLQQALALGQHYDIGLIGRAVALNQVNQVAAFIHQFRPHCDYLYLLVNTLSPNLREALLNFGAHACLSKPAHHRKLATTLSKPYLDKAVSPEWPAQQPQSSVKVLTVDDNDANLKLINALISEQADQVDSACDGAEAWHKATQHAYDIIFMDINMPVMDGITACQRIRQSSLNEHTPIIAVTAHAVEGERARLLTLGFNEFLSKPLDENMLQCCLQEFCAGFRQAPTQAPADAISVWPDSKWVDWPLALERAGGKSSLVREMLQLLLNSIAPCREALQQALAKGDTELLIQHVHKLHGACCYTGVPRLKQLAETLETQLKQGKALAQLQPEFYELDDVLQALWQESQSWQNWQ